MIHIQHVLCAVDFSECSRRALHCAVRVAGWCGARVTAFHVVLPPATIAFSPYAGALTSPAAERSGLKNRLREFVGETSRAVPVQMEMHEGDMCHDIVDRATGGGADLIVMGLHGRSPNERFALGSVAECVARRHLPGSGVSHGSRRPRRERRHGGGSHFVRDRLLQSVSRGDGIRRCAREAGWREVTVLHVVETLPESVRTDNALFEVPAYLRPLLRDAAGRLHSAIRPDWDAWLEDEQIVFSDNPPSAILDLARRQGSDLIVLGARGRKPSTISLFGSTAERVVRAAPCPVLVVAVPASSVANVFASCASRLKETMP